MRLLKVNGVEAILGPGDYQTSLGMEPHQWQANIRVYNLDTGADGKWILY